MSWMDRATPVDEDAPQASSWKDRAKPVDEPATPSWKNRATPVQAVPPAPPASMPTSNASDSFAENMAHFRDENLRAIPRGFARAGMTLAKMAVGNRISQPFGNPSGQDEFFQGGENLLNEKIAAPTETQGQFVEGLTKATVQSAPFLAAAAPAALAARGGALAQGATSGLGTTASGIIGGTAAAAVGASEGAVASAIPEVMAGEAPISAIPHSLVSPFTGAASLAKKVVTGDVGSITPEEGINAAFLVAGGAKGYNAAKGQLKAASEARATAAQDAAKAKAAADAAQAAMDAQTRADAAKSQAIADQYNLPAGEKSVVGPEFTPADLQKAPEATDASSPGYTLTKQGKSEVGPKFDQESLTKTPEALPANDVLTQNPYSFKATPLEGNKPVAQPLDIYGRPTSDATSQLQASDSGDTQSPTPKPQTRQKLANGQDEASVKPEGPAIAESPSPKRTAQDTPDTVPASPSPSDGGEASTPDSRYRELSALNRADVANKTQNLKALAKSKGVDPTQKTPEVLIDEIMAAETAAPEPSRPRGRPRGRNGGFVDLSGIPETAKDIANSPVGAVVKETAGKGLDLAFRDTIDRAAAEVKGPLGDKIDSKFRATVDETNAIRGDLHPITENIHRATKGLPFTESGKDVAEMTQIDRPANAPYGFAKWKLAGENKATLSRPGAQNVVRDIQQLTAETGKVMERSGATQVDASGQHVPFVAKGETAINRVPHTDLMEVQARPAASKNLNEIATAISRANVDAGHKWVTPEKVMNGMFGEVPGTTGAGDVRRVNMERMRKFPVMPDVVYLKDGTAFNVLETSPFDYASRLADLTSSRAATIKNLGQENPLDNRLGELKTEYAQSGNPKKLEDSLRAVQRLPVEPPLTDHTTKGYQAIAGAKKVGNIVRNFNLSKAAVQNLAEAATLPFSHASWRDMPGIYRDLFRKAPRETAYKLGAATQDFANLSIGSQRPVMDTLRAAEQVTSRIFGNKFANELGETGASQIGIRVADRMKAGKGHRGDINYAQRMGFKIEDAQRLAAGKGTPAEYQGIATRSAPRLVGDPINPAERTITEHKPAFKALVRFSSYAFKTQRDFYRTAKVFAQTADAFRKGKTDFRQVAVAGERLVRQQVGATFAGAVGYIGSAYLLGGSQQVKDALADAKEHPGRFLAESYGYTMFGGPLASFFRATGETSSAGASKQAINMTYPGRQTNEVIDMLNSNGVYRGKNGFQKFGQFLNRQVPIGEVGLNMLAVAGYHEERQRTKVALRSFYGWKNKYDKSGTYTPGDSDEFGDNMARAYYSLRNKEGNNAFMKHIEAALKDGGKTPASIAQSLRGKKVLSDISKDKRADFEKSVSKQTMQTLQEHDDMLEAWAREMTRKPPSLDD